MENCRFIIEYHPTRWRGISDGGVNLYVDRLVGLPGEIALFQISNFSIINEIRARIAEGRLDNADFIFRFDGNDYICNIYGNFNTWPKGFGDDEIDRSARILRAAGKKKKLVDKHI